MRNKDVANKLNRKRSVHRNPNLENHLTTARTNLNSIKGKAFRKNRGCEIETHFAQLKNNRRVRRLTHSSIEKVEVEVGLHFTAQNIKKMYQALWLNGIGLLEWLENRSYSTEKGKKKGKTSSKPSFFNYSLTKLWKSGVRLLKKVVYPQPSQRLSVFDRGFVGAF